MRTTVNTNNKFTLIEEMSNDSIFQVLEYFNVEGNKQHNIEVRRDLTATLKQARILLDDSSIIINPKTFSYMKGNIFIKNKSESFFEFGKKIIGGNSQKTIEEKIMFQGTGEIFLNSTFNYLALIELEDDEIIIDNDIFMACENSIVVTGWIQKNILSKTLGDRGISQIKLKGSGIVILEIPVPESEIIRCKLYKDRLVINDDFVVLRTNNIQFTVEKSGSPFIGNLANGDGLVNVYSGIGEVWLLPTKAIYEQKKDSELEYELDKGWNEFQ